MLRDNKMLIVTSASEHLIWQGSVCRGGRCSNIKLSQSRLAGAEIA